MNKTYLDYAWRCCALGVVALALSACTKASPITTLLNPSSQTGPVPANPPSAIVNSGSTGAVKSFGSHGYRGRVNVGEERSAVVQSSTAHGYKLLSLSVRMGAH